MNIAKLAIKRPVFITSIVILIMIFGFISFFKIGREFFPDVSQPTFGVTTIYSGVSPEEIEQLITKPLEDEFGSIPGLKHISSENSEGLSIITLEFDMDYDAGKAAQKILDKINIAKNNLPPDLENDPILLEFDPNAESVVKLALITELPQKDAYDIAKETVKQQLEMIKDVGKVEITGGSRREIQIEIDLNKINECMIPLTKVVNQIKNSGSNIPIGKKVHGTEQTIYRSMGEFNNFEQISNTLVSFSGDMGNAVSLKTLGSVKDGLQDIESRSYIYYPENTENLKSNNENDKGGQVKTCINLDVVKQSGKNTVEVVERVKIKLKNINEKLKKINANTSVIVIYDGSREIHAAINETVTSIIIGIILAVLVVLLFLGNIRSTMITAIAIPNSLLGAVIMLNIMGYTFNIISLMALSLVIGLLVDDAIVVRENIFRKHEEGMNPFKAAEYGTTEVMLAVIATTLVILAVFLPISMLDGMIGRMFKQFGFTVAFAMLVSLFDALTVAPFLSAYFAGDGKKSNNIIIRYTEKFQEKVENLYSGLIKLCLNHQLTVILTATVIFVSSLGLLSLVKANFMPSEDNGEFALKIDMASGTSLKGTEETLKKILDKIQKIKDVNYFAVTAGNSNGEVTKGEIDLFLNKKRDKTTDEIKEIVRSMLSEFSYANPKIASIAGGPEDDPFVLIISGNDLVSVQKWAATIAEKIKGIPDLTDVDISMKSGNPEYRIKFDEKKMTALGVSNNTAGTELRYSIAGVVVGQYYDNGIKYDIRARLKQDQQDLQKNFNSIKVPNNDDRMIPLNMIANAKLTEGSAKINRRDKAYIVNITANLKADGAIGSAMDMAESILKNEIHLPSDVSYSFSGGAEDFSETGANVLIALVMAFIFMYLVLASLYESFITPVTILLAVPPALTGAILALFITNNMLDLYSMIGIIMLMGLVTKNSILLVDHAVHGVKSGLDRKSAILLAGQRRLRPILMTTFAMIAGMFPLAFGFGEAGKIRQSMGISIIGGVIVSTFITLVVVPAVFEYIDRFREATEDRILIRETSDLVE